ncbi:photosynthetic reaction center cytochrome c subunit [Polymorphobacter arshaanensis]|uniref:Photosynthetic reaction center cytochrome c subunit n=1 Tax=Glacieibacterium arshaanense TaxID=2511025 RepID=A0A4Y9EM28_9SPHN|nr:photosynthetic reaction center cytochrome PufC [Polymorphobacter arshaanensis]TFU03115.1 photosynthetic reaction center cytochrome c subunit [Polymorphobacter arshaanensis]
MNQFPTRIGVFAVVGLSAALLGGCEFGPKQTTQTGHRGTGMDQIVAVNYRAKQAAIPPEPYPLPPDGGPTAAESYQNVKVLGNVSKERFDHLMAEMSQWVAPETEGCNYCHNPENLASDEKYTKVVARRMLQMTQTINAQWSPHVKQTGVTCYTCHRGQPVPANKWAMADAMPASMSILGNKRGQNSPSPEVGFTSLPYDPFTQFLVVPQQIRVAGSDPFPQPNHVVSIKDTEMTYALMMHMSSALGVNCTFCHNTQSFRAWNLSTPPRGTAYYGIRMVRDINETYLASLQNVFPNNRKGPHGDVYKVNCTTCHQGVSKPLGGVSMIAQAPALKGPTLAPAAAASPVTAAAATDAVAAEQTPLGEPAVMTAQQ